jgi:lipoyl(octanoyl) transferase
VKNKQTTIVNLGLVEYKKALDIQTQYFEELVAKKLKNRLENTDIQTDNYVLICEHPHVYTLGRSGDKNNLLISEANLHAKNAQYFETGRGGDITYHGPGQVVIYPILDLDNFFTDIHKYLRFLEEAVILTLDEYGLKAGRIDGLTGVWLDHEKQLFPRKICAMGVKASRWVTMHGLALNVNTDLTYFGNIVPCGINDKAVTSLKNELGREIDFTEVANKLVKHIFTLFEMEIGQKV